MVKKQKSIFFGIIIAMTLYGLFHTKSLRLRSFVPTNATPQQKDLPIIQKQLKTVPHQALLGQISGSIKLKKAPVLEKKKKTSQFDFLQKAIETQQPAY